MTPTNENILYLCLGVFLCMTTQYFYGLYNPNMLNCSGPCLPHCFECTIYIYVIVSICATIMLYFFYKNNDDSKNDKK